MFSLIVSSVLSDQPIGQTCTERTVEYDCGNYLFCNITNGTTGFCAACTQDSDCRSHFYCRENSQQKMNLCRYEPLLHKWDARLIGGIITVFFAGIFVSGAGIGGGGLYVPILMLLIDFPSSYSIQSSKALIWGGSVAVTLFNLNKKHPFYDRPLINFNVAAIIEPISWLGTILGVIFNAVIPDWLLYSAQFILLSFTAYSTFKKGIKDQQKAKAARENGGTDSLLSTHTGQYSGPAYSKLMLVLLFIVWVVFLFVSVIRGGDGADSFIGIKFCSTWYWILTFGPFPIYAIINWWMLKLAKNYPILGEHANITPRSLITLLMSGFVAGIAAGFLGIGGGMIKGPMMLALDIEAEEMAATSTFMILMTSSATSIQYIAMGTMPIAEFFVFAAIGFTSFLVGIIFLRWLVRKLGNRSIFLYFLAGLIAVSAVCMTVVGIKLVVDEIKNHDKMGFKPFCH